MEEFIKKIKEPVSRYELFRERVVAECNVSRQTFFNWADGKGIEEKYKPIIDRIAIELYGSPVFVEES